MQAPSSKTIFVSNAARFVGRNRWVQRDIKPGTKCSNKNKILVVSINGYKWGGPKADGLEWKVLYFL
jgi:hypothetical protein